MPALALACAGHSAPSKPDRSAACKSLAAVQGPEDFVIDRSVDPPRLLVSSRKLPKGSKTDGIYAVSLDPSGKALPARELRPSARDDCSFHPHGISLVHASLEPGGTPSEQDPWLLYVINHHGESDAEPKTDCVAATKAGKKTVSVEVFRVEPSRLVFIQRLTAPSILTNANDLVALPDGQIWITNPPPTTLQQLREGLFEHVNSKVVHFACKDRDAKSLRCASTPESWSVAWEGGRFVNGIEYAPANGTAPERLFVASSAGKAIYPFLVTSTGELVEGLKLDLDTAPDNLTWIDPERRHTLLIAAHPNLRRLVQHAIRHRSRSPSQVVRLELGDVPRSWTVFRNDGSVVSGASTAACFEGDLILGKIFGKGVLRCQVDPPCDGTAGELAAQAGETR